MIKVSVFYPRKDGAGFDMGYYVSSHMPMVRQKLGAACKGVAAEQGLAGGDPGSPPLYAAIGHLMFDSVEAFQAAFAPHAAEIMADIPNYTTIQPIIQISDVKMS
ncbi:EthD family reductase [Vineibacter terrae]|uniref:EthD family reductase n=1 Tax=Vineibacter terrae TaxID=2586908 RepID=A0A5C8PV46_9HYPH|nr:EthD family reductase [Vineibacter terrae]TXL81730.1 EthD family reductase [Vineibacter terrae]